MLKFAYLPKALGQSNPTCCTSVSAGWVDEARSPNVNQVSSLYRCTRVVRNMSLSSAITHTCQDTDYHLVR